MRPVAAHSTVTALAAATAVATATALLAGGSAAAAPAARHGALPVAAGLSAAAPEAARIRWKECRGRAFRAFQCARYSVPKDYTDARAGTFRLAVVRLPATGPRRERIGSLFFNPGGPGIATVAIAPQVAAGLPKQLRRHFDFVTWDPRGVGLSAGLADCPEGSYTLPATGAVDWADVLARMRESEAEANGACIASHPDVAPYIGTNATVRDLDRLRAAVGDRKLTYWGNSYGTKIGFVYAQTFPRNVRAMVQSSSVTPAGDWAKFASEAALAPDAALGLVFERYPGSAGHYRAALRTLQRQPLRLPSGAVFNRWHLGMVPQMSVASESKYGEIAAFYRNVDTAVNGSGAARRTAIRSLDSTPWPETFPTQAKATTIIDCLDTAQRLAPEEQLRIADGVLRQAAVLGWANLMATVYCEGVTLPPDPVPMNFTNWTTPMLIVGSTRDALTPYSWTIDMARAFRNSRVVTFSGGQHGPYLGAGSRCVDRIGTRYLVTGRWPAQDVACPAA